METGSSTNTLYLRKSLEPKLYTSRNKNSSRKIKKQSRSFYPYNFLCTRLENKSKMMEEKMTRNINDKREKRDGNEDRLVWISRLPLWDTQMFPYSHVPWTISMYTLTPSFLRPLYIQIIYTRLFLFMRTEKLEKMPVPLGIDWF